MEERRRVAPYVVSRDPDGVDRVYAGTDGREPWPGVPRGGGHCGPYVVSVDPDGVRRVYAGIGWEDAQ